MNELLAELLRHADRQDRFRLSISKQGGPDEEEPWVVGYEFGREAPDSPMYGAASYSSGATLDAAIDAILHEVQP